MRMLKDNVITYDTLAELNSDLDITDLFTSDYYLSSGDLLGIAEDMDYNDVGLNQLVKLTTNGYGGSQWSIIYIAKDDLHVLINNWV